MDNAQEHSLSVERNTINTIENMEEISDDEDKFKSIFMSTFFTILLLIVSISYSITWAVIFNVYSLKQYPDECFKLKQWDKTLFIILYITSLLHLVSSIIQIFTYAYNKESNIPQYITFCRSCINYLAGIVILIGINVEYFNIEDPSVCGVLSKINLAYIITEWSIIGLFICLILIVCGISLMLKKRKGYLD